jgi:hypothetical protein
MRNINLATKTLKAIEDAIAKDQGAAYRQNLQKVLPHMGDAYRGVEDNPYRSHLGASVIGTNCPRAIWYGFRWFTKPTFTGRILRLFNRGHMEEARFIACLLTIGCQVYQQDEHGKQYRISDLGGHFGGSSDGVVIGLPDLPPGLPAVAEFKTHSDKYFKQLKTEGVRVSKFEHFVQMQVYMRKMGVTVALYMAVNKNDDELYAEIVQLETIVADQFIDRGRQIIMLKVAPDKISKTPGWFECSWCDHKPVCHLKKAPERNCRTCIHSDPREDGRWYCTNGNQIERATSQGWEDPIELTTEAQLKGCEDHESF